MNRRLLSVGVFLTLMLTSLLAGHHNYCTARNELTADLNQALAQTLKENRDYYYYTRYDKDLQTPSSDFGRTGTDCSFRRTLLPPPEE